MTANGRAGVLAATLGTRGRDQPGLVAAVHEQGIAPPVVERLDGRGLNERLAQRELRVRVLRGLK